MGDECRRPISLREKKKAAYFLRGTTRSKKDEPRADVGKEAPSRLATMKKTARELARNYLCEWGKVIWGKRGTLKALETGRKRTTTQSFKKKNAA